MVSYSIWCVVWAINILVCHVYVLLTSSENGHSSNWSSTDNNTGPVMLQSILMYHMVYKVSMLVQYITRSISGLVQGCSNSIANAMELLQSCTKPVICKWSMLCCVLSLVDITKILEVFFTGTKAIILAWTNVNLSSTRSGSIHPRAISQDLENISITRMCLKNMHVKFTTHLPGAN